MAAAVVRFLAAFVLLALGAVVGAVLAASAALGFRAHPELFLPLVVIALAAAGVAWLARSARRASRIVVDGEAWDVFDLVAELPDD